METPANPQMPVSPPPPPGRKRNIIIAVLVVVIIVLLYGMRQSFTKNDTADAPAKKEPLFHRDEPAKEQIFQGDYEDKVKELLDSGKSVGEISRETGIRRDVVRKIKKEYDDQKD